VSSSTIALRRRAADYGATAISYIAALVVLAPLVAILSYLLMKGATSSNLAFFTEIPKPVGEPGGGMANAIGGSLLILGIASAIGIPVGVGTGVYLAEIARSGIGRGIRFLTDVLNGVPSIVIGLAAYSLVVIRQKHFSAISGGIALGAMMIPTIARATEEMLKLVPLSVREAALGLGIPQWRTTLSITLRSALPGIITGIMLAFSRVAGETAPLLFTAFGNAFWNWDPRQPTAALPLQIFVYAISPFEDWHRKAWAGALVLVAIIMVSVFAVRWVASRGTFKGTS
jgi:phosphate transport system permease protein